jgi:heme/copper-type cytochrome/quinol oxidase subunit 2
MSPLTWAITLSAAIFAIFVVVIGLAIWAQARARKADYRDTGHDDT